MKIAFFDIDGTLTRRSSERWFIRHLMRERILSGGRIAVTAVCFALRYPIKLRRGFKENKMYLRGLSTEAVERAARRCFEESIRPDVKKNVVEEIVKRKKDGFRIVLLSGSLRCLAEPMASFCGADDVLCSEVDVKDGRFTGRMISRHPYGFNKKRIAEEYATQSKASMNEACAFANEWPDRFLMTSVGEAVAVDPDERLKALALQKKWRIMDSAMEKTA